MIRNVRRLFEMLESRLLLSGSPDVLTITGLTADTQVSQDGTVSFTGNTPMRLGTTSNLQQCDVFVFQLPALPGGRAIGSASLSFYLASNAGTPTAKVGLYGLGFRAFPTVQATDYFSAAYNTDTTDATAIQDAVLPGGAPPATITTSTAGNAALASYLTTQYNAGGKNQYIFLRLSPDAAMAWYTYYNVAGADAATASQRPVLTINLIPGPPLAPDTLTATPVSVGRIDLGWYDNADNEDGFKVERSTDGTTFTQIGTTGPNVTTYSDTSSMTAGVTYYYRVCAYNTLGNSLYSNTSTAVAPAPILVQAPTNLAATLVPGALQINLTWTDNANNENGFRIQRSTDGVTFATMGTAAANATSFNDSTGLATGMTYYYRVCATSASQGDSPYSALASMRALPTCLRYLYVDAASTATTPDGSLAKPYKTITAAVAVSIPGDGIIVRGGTYYGTVTMKPGTAANPIYLMGYPGERATITGFKAITGWQLWQNGIYVTTLSGWKPNDLYVNYTEQPLSQDPNDSWAAISNLTGTTLRDPRLVNYPYNVVGDYVQIWTAAGNTFMGTTIIAQDTVNGTITLASAGTAATGDLYMIRNDPALIDTPGEWAAKDQGDGTCKVYFRPVNVADLTATQAPSVTDRLILQSSYGVTGHDFVLDNLEVTGSLGMGIQIGGGATTPAYNITIRNCIVHDNASSGISFRMVNNVTASQNIVLHNYTGISVASTVGGVIEKNEVAFSLADGMDIAGDVSGNNSNFPSSNIIVRNNYVHNQYLWDHPDNLQMYNNVTDVHFVDNFVLGAGQGLMTESTSGNELAGNVFLGSDAYMIIFGHSNSSNWTVHSNTIGLAHYGIYSFTATGYDVRENITLGSVSVVSTYTGDYNLYWTGDPAATILVAPGFVNYTTVAAFYAAFGQEQHSVKADPLLTNVPKLMHSITNQVNCTTTTLYLDSTANMYVGDHVEVNWDGVVRTITAVDASTITLDIPLPARPIRSGDVADWGASRNFQIDTRPAIHSPALTASATGGQIGSLINTIAYTQGDFTGDGIRDLPVLWANVIPPDPNRVLPPEPQAANEPPKTFAGSDTGVQLPVGATSVTVSLAGVVTNDTLPPRTGLTTTWSILSGPAAVTIANTAATSTTATFTTPGMYTLRLTAADSALSAWDDINIWVVPTTLTGTSGADTFIVQRDASGANVQIFQNVPTTGLPTWLLPAAALQTLTIDAQGGDDSLTIDCTRGSTAAPGGLAFLGGLGNDSLALVGATPTDAFGITSTQITHGSATMNYSGAESLSLTTGSYTLAADLGGLSLTIAAAVQVSTSQNLDALALLAGASLQMASGSPLKVLSVKSLAVAGTAVLDPTSNDLIIDYTGGPSPLTTIEALASSGYNAGDWRGKGIASSSAAGNPGLYSVAVLDNATRPTPFDTFDGVNTSSHKQVLVKLTWVADIDLDGLVTSNDAVTFAANYSDGAPASHQVGDFNYNHVFDSNDAILFASAYNESLPQINTVVFPASLALASASLTPALTTTQTKAAATVATAPATAAHVKPGLVLSPLPAAPAPPTPKKAVEPLPPVLVTSSTAKLKKSLLDLNAVSPNAWAAGKPGGTL